MDGPRRGGRQDRGACARHTAAFLTRGKTERECVAYGVELARARGFEDMREAVRADAPLSAGSRVYVNWMNKSLLLFIVGKKRLEEGMNILGAHIDSPRIDTSRILSMKKRRSRIWTRTITAASKNTSGWPCRLRCMA